MLKKLSGYRVHMYMLVLVGLYVLLGNSRSIKPNPFIPGATIAIQMIVPVATGLLFGAWPGFIVGLLGTAVNSFTPAGSLFEILAILPHAVMGFTAGVLQRRFEIITAAFALATGHLLNLIYYWLAGLVTTDLILSRSLYKGVWYEIVLEIIGVMVIVFVYRTGFKK